LNGTVIFSVDICVLGKSESNSTILSEVKDIHNLNGDINNLLDNDELFSDISIKCGNTLMHAHRSVIAARSTVLKEKFNETFFNLKYFFKGNKWVFTSCEEDVFLEFMKFIYSDKLSEEALIKYARPLLAVSKKYQLTGILNIKYYII
jgi:hypothetical protein